MDDAQSVLPPDQELSGKYVSAALPPHLCLPASLVLSRCCGESFFLLSARCMGSVEVVRRNVARAAAHSTHALPHATRAADQLAPIRKPNCGLAGIVAATPPLEITLHILFAVRKSADELNQLLRNRVKPLPAYRGAPSRP